MRMRSLNVLFIALIIVVVDQLTKFLLEDKVIKLASFFWLNYAENVGGAFGLLQGYKWLFIIVAVIVIFLLAFYWRKMPRDRKLLFGAGFLLGGVVGNLIDRVFRGFVVDFIDFKVWPVFNVADVFVVVGIILIAWFLFKNS